CCRRRSCRPPTSRCRSMASERGSVMKKLPPEAFSFYVGLGPERSYQAVAKQYGVSKQAVTKLAVREEWRKRLDAIERRAQQGVDQRATETLEIMNERHLKTLQVIQRKALETLKAMPLTTAMDAVRALDIGIRQERLVRGEPSERTAIGVEEVIRREYDRWLGSATEDGDGRDDE